MMMMMMMMMMMIMMMMMRRRKMLMTNAKRLMTIMTPAHPSIGAHVLGRVHARGQVHHLTRPRKRHAIRRANGVGPG
jgi:hypothetical protein